jgi:hypothetical protein
VGFSASGDMQLVENQRAINSQSLITSIASTLVNREF